jgi:pimeloyl-ACP methyl ester carboxylesterase
MPRFERDGISFHYHDQGAGLPFVFQHGLGGELGNPVGLYRQPENVRFLTFDMRGHGQTRPLGDVDQLRIAVLADDLVALLDHLGIEQAVVGGISLGAAVAVSMALRSGARVSGLVLSRPAWIDGPLPENVERYTTIARLIREKGTVPGRLAFEESPRFQAIRAESPDCAASLIAQFESPRARECVARLERLASDTPCHDRANYQSVRVPTLVLGNHRDPIHPWAVAQTLARLIPGAELKEIAPKSVSLETHTADVQSALDAFLTRLLSTRSQGR